MINQDEEYFVDIDKDVLCQDYDEATLEYQEENEKSVSETDIEFE